MRTHDLGEKVQTDDGRNNVPDMQSVDPVDGITMKREKQPSTRRLRPRRDNQTFILTTLLLLRLPMQLLGLDLSAMRRETRFFGTTFRPLFLADRLFLARLAAVSRRVSCNAR